MDLITLALAMKKGGGGGGESYEAVAEISVGAMTKWGSNYKYTKTNTPVPVIDRNATYYLNDASYQNDDIDVEDDYAVIAFNTILGEQGRVDSSKPYIMFEWASGTLNVISDTNDAENKTFTILKKVSGERPVDFIITADLDIETWEITNASASIVNVLAVAGESRNIVFILHTTAESGGTTVNVYDRFADSTIENYGDGNGVVSFSKLGNDDGTPLLCRITATSGDNDGKWVYDEMPLATATP